MTTIRDIAKMTGVSVTTVSNVIHGKDNRVSADTIKKVNDAIKELGYTPNMTARSLVSSRSNVVGFINHAISRNIANVMEDPFHSTAIGAIETVLSDNGYYLMFRTVESTEELVAFLQNWNIDGMFFTGIFKDDFYDSISRLDIPIVFIDSYVHSPKFCNVGLEDFNGCYNATRYLIEKGHRNIGFVSPTMRNEGVIYERFQGYRAALSEASISFKDEYIFQYKSSGEVCKQASGEIIKHPELTALVTSSDIIAAGIMVGLKSHGVRIPDDISIIGFDDISIAKLVTPPLTTIRQDMNLKGQMAADYMLRRLRGEHIANTEIMLPTELIERDTVKTL